MQNLNPTEYAFSVSLYRFWNNEQLPVAVLYVDDPSRAAPVLQLTVLNPADFYSDYYTLVFTGLILPSDLSLYNSDYFKFYYVRSYDLKTSLINQMSQTPLFPPLATSPDNTIQLTL